MKGTLETNYKKTTNTESGKDRYYKEVDMKLRRISMKEYDTELDYASFFRTYNGAWARTEGKYTRTGFSN